MKGIDYTFSRLLTVFLQKEFFNKKVLKLQKPNISTDLVPCILRYAEQHNIAILGKEWSNMEISHSLTSYLTQFMPIISSAKMSRLCKTDDNQ